MKKFLYILILAPLLSCVHRPLEEIFIEDASIPVRIDWRLSFLDPSSDRENLYNSSLWLYSMDGTPFEGKSYKEYSFDSPVGGFIEAPMGKYRVIVLNNAITNFTQNVSFRGVENYNTFEYYARKNGDNTISESDILAVWRTSDFEITPDMVIATHNPSTLSADRLERAQEGLKQLSDIQPIRLTSIVNVKVHAKNIENVKSTKGVLTGMAQSVKLWDGSSSTPSDYQFFFEERVVTDKLLKTGYVYSSFNTINPSIYPDALHYLSFRFMLTSKDESGNDYYPAVSDSPFKYDVSNEILDLSQTLPRTITIDVGSDGSKPIIVLPEVDPGGFNPGIGDWGDEEDIELKPV